MMAPSSAIVRQAFTSSSKATVVNRGFRSTPRIASTARRVTSRTRPRISTGSHPKAAEATALGSVPAQARITVSDAARTYVQARAAAMVGDHARAAQLLASLAASQPDQVDIARKALTEAVGAGQMDLALKLAHTVPAASLPGDARLLLVGEEIRRGHPDRAVPWLGVSGQ